MKLINTIVVIVLIVLCVLGWMTFGSNRASQQEEFEAAVAQAEQCVDSGLYQRAIKSYQAALDGAADEDIYLKIANAYSLRYNEAPQDTYDDYLAFVKKALNAFPGNRTLVDHLVFLCLNEEMGEMDYKTLYPYLKRAVANVCEDEETAALYAQARYAYSLRANIFRRIVDSGNGKYSVLTDRGWNVYTISGGYQLTSNWDYVGPSSDDGIAVITGEDSRIYDVSSSMVLGIFSSQVIDAGIYSDGLIPAKVDGTFGYYNDYAQYQFGDYDYAGSFQNGLAAVEANGKWMLVNTKGEVERDDLEQIVTDPSGRYVVNDVILVKEAGSYVVYDAKWKRKADLTCDEVDLLTQDGVVAFRSGDKWGFADMAGHVVIEPKYPNARSFSNGLAAVQDSDGLWGFIDQDDRLVIDHTFTDVGYMSSAGICPVRVDVPGAEPENGTEAEDGSALSEEWALLSLVNGITKD